MDREICARLADALQRELPEGWERASVVAHVAPFTELAAAVGPPWNAVVDAMLDVLWREHRASAGWIPAGADDPVLAEALAVALDRTRPRAPAPGERARAVVERWIDCVDLDPAAFDASLAALPVAARHLVVVHWLRAEVENGGFWQFFHNSTGMMAPHAGRALRAIGAPGVRAVVAGAVRRLGRPYPRGDEVRRARLAALPGADPFATEDEAFSAACEADALDARCDAYAGGRRSG